MIEMSHYIVDMCLCLFNWLCVRVGHKSVSFLVLTNEMNDRMIGKIHTSSHCRKWSWPLSRYIFLICRKTCFELTKQKRSDTSLQLEQWLNDLVCYVVGMDCPSSRHVCIQPTVCVCTLIWRFHLATNKPCVSSTSPLSYRSHVKQPSTSARSDTSPTVNPP